MLKTRSTSATTQITNPSAGTATPPRPSSRASPPPATTSPATACGTTPSRILERNSSWATPSGTPAPTSSVAGTPPSWPTGPRRFKPKFRAQVLPSRPCSGSAAHRRGLLAEPAARQGTVRFRPFRPPACRRWSTCPDWSAAKCPPWWPTPPIYGFQPVRPPPQETSVAPEQACCKAPSCPTGRLSGNTDGPCPATRSPATSTSKARTCSSPPAPAACSNSTPPPAPFPRWAARSTANSTRCTRTTTNS